MRTPSGREIAVAGEAGDTTWIPLEAAGIYALKVDKKSQLRAANHARPPRGGILERSRIEAGASIPQIVWLGREDFIPREDLHGSPQGSAAPAYRYDLTVIVAALLAGFLGTELMLLLTYWRGVRE